MIIKTLELSNFRNYGTLMLELADGVNILYGDNAQGKTNILEAIYVCSTTRSQRAGKEREMIRFGSDEAHIRMTLKDKVLESERRIDMHLKNGHAKGVAVDGLPIAKAADLYGMVNIISFTPDDLSMIKDGPAERRRFIDMELCQLDKSYMYNLSSYNKTLLQRNNLLKQLGSNKELASTLQIWDEQLCNYGSYIISKRSAFIKEIEELARRVHSGLSHGTEELSLKYQPNTSAEGMSEALFMAHERDTYLQSTSVGPHRDDMLFILNSEDARKYGSQGQQRTAALSMKLAEIELVRKKTGQDPVLLLDDVLSELDRSRQSELLDNIHDIQTIITCTGLEEFVNNRVRYDRIYKVTQGTVTEGELQ